MSEKRIVLTGPIAARLAAHVGPADHPKFDLSRVLWSPSLGMFLATNSYALLAIEPMPAVTCTPWTPTAHKPVTKEVWIKAADLIRASEVCSDIGNQLDFVDNGEHVGFWISNRFVACDVKTDKPTPPISMRFFPKESAPIATLFGAKELQAMGQTMAAIALSAKDPSNPGPVTLAVHGHGWSQSVLEFSMIGPGETTCRAVIMPMTTQERPDYAMPYSGKAPEMNDGALRMLDWRTAPAQQVDPASPDIELAIDLLTGLKIGSAHPSPKGLDADQLASARLLLTHAVSAIKVIRSGG
jgi:hypothetical protein